MKKLPKLPPLPWDPKGPHSKIAGFFIASIALAMIAFFVALATGGIVADDRIELFGYAVYFIACGILFALGIWQAAKNPTKYFGWVFTIGGIFVIFIVGGIVVIGYMDKNFAQTLRLGKMPIILIAFLLGGLGFKGLGLYLLWLSYWPRRR